MIESIVVLTLGVVLLSFTCKCAIVLVKERRNNAIGKIFEASVKGTVSNLLSYDKQINVVFSLDNY